MHGRIKVKTSAEQAEAKRVQRSKKAKLYSEQTQAFLKKNHSKEYDEEGLTLSYNLLSANPDFTSAWNFRKEHFLQVIENTYGSKTNIQSVASLEDDVHKMAKEELRLTETCLYKQPKSYGAWIHRIWVLEHIVFPDWAKELEMCDQCLKLDDRNFHCWDHRRVVCKLAKVPVEDELNFTMKKIEANFSNHSAWHYRSSLLTLINSSVEAKADNTESTTASSSIGGGDEDSNKKTDHVVRPTDLLLPSIVSEEGKDGSSDEGKVSPSTIPEEQVLQTDTSVTIVDNNTSLSPKVPKKVEGDESNDSDVASPSDLKEEPKEKEVRSPNFPSLPLNVLEKEFDLVTNAAFTDPTDQSIYFYLQWLMGREDNSQLRLQQLVVPSSSQPIYIQFSQKATKEEVEEKVQLYINKKEVQSPIEWFSEKAAYRSVLWWAHIPHNNEDEISITFESVPDVLVRPPNKRCVRLKGLNDFRSKERNEAESSFLTSQLDVWQELQEMEPNSKYPTLYLLSFMTALNFKREQRVAHYEDLLTIDPSRKNYYLDMISKLLIEEELSKLSGEEDFISFKSLGLTNLYHGDLLLAANTLNFQLNNNLTTLKALPNLPLLREITIGCQDRPSTKTVFL